MAPYLLIVETLLLNLKKELEMRWVALALQLDAGWRYNLSTNLSPVAVPTLAEPHPPLRLLLRQLPPEADLSVA